MNKQGVRIDTIEEMIHYATSNIFNADRKWMLEDSTQREFVDKEAGEKFMAELAAVPFVSYKDEPAHSHYELVRKEIESRRPEMKFVTYWTLVEQTPRYHKTRINLSEELGVVLDKVWKTKPMYRGSSQFKRTGYISIPGMLQRLGETDIKNKVAQAKLNAKLQSEKNIRNYARKEVNRLAKEIKTIMDKHPDIIFPSQLAELSREDFMNVYGEQ